MTDWRGKDPRGEWVILRSGVWFGHVLPQRRYLAPYLNEVLTTLENPDLIIDNDPHPASPPRKALERYVRYSSTMGRNVIVPVTPLATDEEHATLGALAAGTRDTFTVFAGNVPPHNRVIWSPAATAPTVVPSTEDEEDDEDA